MLLVSKPFLVFDQHAKKEEQKYQEHLASASKNSNRVILVFYITLALSLSLFTVILRVRHISPTIFVIVTMPCY